MQIFNAAPYVQTFSRSVISSVSVTKFRSHKRERLNANLWYEYEVFENNLWRPTKHPFYPSWYNIGVSIDMEIHADIAAYLSLEVLYHRKFI